MRKSQGIILVPAKGTVVSQALTPAHRSHPREKSLLVGPPRPQQPPCPGQRAPTLVDELVEGMLAIGPWLPPHNGARLVVHASAGLGDILPVGLHVTLEQGQRPSPLAASLAFLHALCLDPAWDAPCVPALPCVVSTSRTPVSPLTCEDTGS